MDGVKIGRSYHLSCKPCGTVYWHSYSVRSHRDQDNMKTFSYNPTNTTGYFQLTRATAFERRYMREVIVDIGLGRSFEEVTERFNRLYGSKETRGDLYKTRVEDGYFVLQLMNYFKSDITVPVNKISNRVNVDMLCDEVVSEQFGCENMWKMHQCSVSGCKEGFVMCDGNEKLSRRICAAPKETLHLSRNMPKIVDKCGNSPVFGGQHQKASKHCKGHIDLDADEPAAKRIVIVLNVPDQTVSTRIVDLSKDLPSNADSTMHVACKKAANVKRFHASTAGIMAIVRPCGIVLDWREMYTCESSSQLFVQLLKLVDESGTRVRYVGYDRACEFVPFLRNLKRKGNLGAEKLLQVQYLVDNFHIAGHTTAVCNIDDPACEFHHKLPKFQEIAGANTECAEQAFSWLKKYKNIVKYMTAPRFRFFMLTVINEHNALINLRTSV